MEEGRSREKRGINEDGGERRWRGKEWGDSGRNESGKDGKINYASQRKTEKKERKEERQGRDGIGEEEIRKEEKERVNKEMEKDRD